jgi:hypothetical protein
MAACEEINTFSRRGGNDLRYAESCSIPVSIKAKVHGDQQQMADATKC